MFRIAPDGKLPMAPPSGGPPPMPAMPPGPPPPPEGAAPMLPGPPKPRAAKFDADKVPQMNAGYLGPENGPFKCGNCEFFDPKGACYIVDGNIDPEGCCNNFVSAQMGDQDKDEDDESNDGSDDGSKQSGGDSQPDESVEGGD